jgi:hypothetical protein
LVQATLGHSSVATTTRYLHARPGDSSARFLALETFPSDGESPAQDSRGEVNQFLFRVTCVRSVSPVPAPSEGRSLCTGCRIAGGHTDSVEKLPLRTRDVHSGVHDLSVATVLPQGGPGRRFLLDIHDRAHDFPWAEPWARVTTALSNAVAVLARELSWQLFGRCSSLVTACPRPRAIPA